MNPKYPIYVISKGRWNYPYTSNWLDKMGVPHRIVVEKQEYKNYTEKLGKNKLLILDEKYKDEYDTCDDLGDLKGKGPGPARNFVWDHALSKGSERHWVMDDNIRFFCRLNRNIKWYLYSGAGFLAMEDFCDRYENVVMAGPQYEMFVPRKSEVYPFTLNTRIYSCNLIKNDIPFKWRGRYNEDTILSLDILKARYCTVLFNAFLQHKLRTQILEGGNTDELYRNGTMPKSQMLKKVHPDVTEVVWKFQRWHHEVDYSKFQCSLTGNKLRKKSGLRYPKGINNYGMILKTLD